MELNDLKRTTWAYDYVDPALIYPGSCDFAHRSYNEHRLADNPVEAQALKTWQDYCARTDVLGHILSEDKSEAHPELLSQRDLEVAATLIQWLGSNVGQGFLKDAGLCIGKA